MVELKRNFKGVWIPKDIWLDNNLSIQEKCFLAEINSLDDEVKGCFALNSHFSELFNLSKNRCSEVIKSLEEKGFISVNYEYNGKQITNRTIKIINRFYPFEKSTDPFEISNTPSENLVDRITLENNILDTIDDSKKSRKTKFVPPTLEEVQKYIEERKSPIDAKFFIDYYTSNNWKDKNDKPIRNWKLKLITWDARERKNKSSNSGSSNQCVYSLNRRDDWNDPEIKKRFEGVYEYGD
jgi:hypothetical protein